MNHLWSWRPLRTLTTWPVDSQTVSRRNALVAGTLLAERRREREDADEYAARLFARDRGATEVVSVGRPA